MEITDIDLMAYADGELDADAARAVEAAVAADPEARAKVEMFRHTSSLLKVACAETFYSTGYSTGLDHLRVPHAWSARTVTWRRAAVAAACLAAGLAGFGGGRLASLPPSARDALLNEVAEYHKVFSREGAHLVELPAANTAELQEWLG